MNTRPRRGARSLALLRAIQFERCEDRLLPSANLLGDFFVSDEEELSPDLGFGEIAPALIEAHQLTGVNYVRDQFGFLGAGQTVAVIDTGIAYDHYALGRGFGPNYRVVGGWDFTEENDANPYDDGPAGYHGTHVAGIVGSNDPVRPGVAPAVDLVALRVFNDQGSGYFSWVENALRWVHQHRNDFEYPITTVNLSMGVVCNSDSPPSWAMLEDELQQLNNDGIFVAVAAGNSFSTYRQPGLSYPASSPYVVPVASVGDTGQMSSFSQRNSRVLAAPGERITSTVPDHVFGADGAPNDWGTASGTSMASPYAAGASVLVREAMQFVGYQNVTQSAIYNQLRNTADSLYDAATGATYRRINMQRALDTLMPADDYGSDASNAYNLGRVARTGSVSGLIGRLSDVDYFTFTAGCTGVAHLTAATTHALAADYGLVGAQGRFHNGCFSFDVVAGRTYTFSLKTAAGLGYYQLAVQLEPTVVDWGTIEFAQHTDQNLSAGNAWFRMTASRNGLLTVEASFRRSGGDIDLEIYNSNNQLLASSRSAADCERLDVSAAAGETFYLRAVGANRDVDFRLSNLVAVSDDIVQVYGTAGDDMFTFAAGAEHQVSVNEVEYRFNASKFSLFDFDGGSGEDAITLTGGAEDQTADLCPGSVHLSSQTYRVHADDVESISVRAGGGTNLARLCDSTGDDTLVARPDEVVLSGPHFCHRVQGFEVTETYAMKGGTNSACFYDSPGNDTFVAAATYANFFGSGFNHYAEGFAAIKAYSNAGGVDYAYFYDSAGDDTFAATPAYANLRGAGFNNCAEHFEAVMAFAAAGGVDYAYLYDSAGNDAFIGTPSDSRLFGKDFYNYAERFDAVFAFAVNGGVDCASLYDSASNDTLIAKPDYAVLFGAGFYNYAQGFDATRSFAAHNGGDSAQFYDSPGNDTLVATAAYVDFFGNGFRHYAQGFAATRAFSTAGGVDYAYFYDSPGNDIFAVTPAYANLWGDGFNNYAAHFEAVMAFATAGGVDYAYLYDSPGDDRLTATPSWATLHNGGFYNYAEGFDAVLAFAIHGGRDSAVLYGSSGNDIFYKSLTHSVLRGAAYYSYLSGFAETLVYSSGGFDSATVDNLTATDAVFGRANYLRILSGASRVWLYDFSTIAAYARNGEAPTADVAALDYFFSRFGDWA